jgi:glycosyltransferase involved in cell wall biosynthesis
MAPAGTVDHRLRILHVVEAFGGGVYEMVRLLTSGLAARSHVVGLAYGIRPETPADVESTLDTRIDRFPMPWTQRDLGAQVGAYGRLRELVHEWQPSVVHLHSSFAGVVGAAAVGRHTPTVYSPHGYSFTMAHSRMRRRGYRSLEQLVARRVTAVGAISRTEAALAEELGTARRVIAVPNGIPELDRPVEGPLAVDRPPAVIAMGRIMAQRQPRQVAEILDGVRDLAPVTWVGGAREDDFGVQWLLAAGIPVTGWLTREEAVAHLSRASAYVHWTAWDGAALSVLEAMAKDVVVVASDVPANRELLGPRQVFGSVASAKAFLRRVLTDGDLRAELLETQRARRPAFSAAAMTENWLTVYDALRAGGSRR